MTSKDLICGNCISICKVPKTVSKELVLRLFYHDLRGRILDTAVVPGIESDTNLARWVVWLESPEDVRNLLERVNATAIGGGHHFTVAYAKTNPCEIPDEWTQRFPTEITMEPPYTQHTMDTNLENPPIPAVRSPHQRGHNRQPHGEPTHVTPTQNQFIVSGFYENLSPDAQIKVEQKNQRRESSQQVGSPDQGAHVGQTPIQGHQYNIPVSGQVPYQGQIADQSHNPERGQTPDQASTNYQGQMHFQGHAPQWSQMSGQNQTQFRSQIPGQGQIPYFGQMLGQSQAPNLDQMPDRTNPKQLGQIPGQFQTPQQGQSSRQIKPQVTRSQMYPNIPFGLHPNFLNMPPNMPYTGFQPGFNPSEANIGRKEIPYQAGPMQYIGHPQLQPSVPVSEYPGLQRQNPWSLDTKDYEHHHESPYSTPYILEQRKESPRMSRGEKVSMEKTETFEEKSKQALEEIIQKPAKKPTKIVVTSLPSKVDEEHLEMFFEKKKIFGEDIVVKNVILDEETNSAVVEFEDPDAVEVVLSKCPLTMMNQKVYIEVQMPEPSASQNATHCVREMGSVRDDVNYEEGSHFYEEISQTPRERPTQIVLSNLPSKINDEYLDMFFENKKRFGGLTVKNVELEEESNSAVVEFDDPDAVDIILSKCPLEMMKQRVDVEVYVPEPPTPLCTITVKGPKDVISLAETLELYFESEKKSDGGNVQNVYYDSGEDVAYVTFESEEIAQRVVQYPDHKINKKQLSVELLKPIREKKKYQKNEQDNNEDIETTEESQEPIYTVRVKGVRAVPSRETFEYYFENTKRSGGSEFESILTDDEDDDIVYIKYKSEEVAQRVAERTHTLEGSELDVELYIPPKPLPCYNNKVLIKGLHPKTTQEGLFNFIEAKSGFVPESMVHHSEDKGVVMVSMEENAGFMYEEFERKLASAKLEGKALKLAKVPVSDCILVSNLPGNITQDTVNFYFENERKSGGGPVKNVVMNDDDTYLVYFEDYTKIDSVLKRKHTLSGEQLLVQRYQECLGRPEGETKERRLKIPDPLEMKNVNPRKLKFLKNSKVNQEMIEQELKKLHVNIVWPNESGDVILECTLTKKVSDCFKLVKTWQTHAEKTFEDFIKKIVVHEIDVLQDLWEKVTEQLKEIHFSKPEAVAVFLEKDEGMIVIVGDVNVAESLRNQVLEIKKKAMEELEKQRQSIKEVVKALKPVEVQLLHVEKFCSEMEKRFDSLKVKINQRRNEIIFEGPSSDVQNAKLAMYERKNCFEIQTCSDISKLKHAIYDSKQGKEFIVRKLKDKDVMAVWKIQEPGKLEICSDRSSITEGVSIILEAVEEKSIVLKDTSIPVLNSEKWSEMLDELKERYKGKCEIAVHMSELIVCATDDIIHEVVENVKMFVKKNTVLVEKIACKKNAHRLIEEHHKELLTRIPNDLQHFHVKVTSLERYGGFEVCGTEDGINIAKKKLYDLLNKVRRREHNVDKPGLSDYMDSSKGRDNLHTIESMLHCVVTVKGEDDEEMLDTSPYDTTPNYSRISKNIGVRAVNIVASCQISDLRHIHIVQGDMTELSVDVLVNPADEKISLSGGLGKAIISKGGLDVERDCKTYVKSSQKLKPGQVFLSTAGNLKAEFIAHVRGPIWKQGHDKEEEKLKEAVAICLEETSSRNLVSIAFPAISCGNYAYPVKNATSTIVRVIKDFFLDEQDSPITDVYLCDVKDNTVECFKEAVGRGFGHQNLQIHSSRHAYEYNEAIDTDEENDTDSYASPVLPRPLQLTNRSTHQQQSSEVKLGNLTASVVKGEIAKQQVDVIVNTTANNLQLKYGSASASLLKAAGQELQKEVDTKYPNGIKDGEIAVTSGHKLTCQTVLHTALAKWDGNDSDSKKAALRKLILDCMDEAEKQNFTSIAFPAIGTGNLGFPRDVVATEMFNAVVKFSPKSLQKVLFVVYQKDSSTIQAFENQIGRYKRNRQGRKFDLYDDLHKYRKGNSANATGDRVDEDDTYEIIGDTSVKQDYKIGNISVEVKQGDITKEDAECIVNSTNEALDLSRGNVSKAILMKGGSTLESELHKFRQKMKKEHLVITSAPGLPCKNIIHIVAKDSSDEWKKIIMNCLQAAESKTMKSIAFPALGTGFKMKAGEIAQTMVRAVSEFEASKPQNLSEIHLVIYQAEMVEEFHKAIRESGNKDTGWSLGGMFKAIKGYMTGQSDQHDTTYTKSKTKKSSSKVTFLIYAMSDDIIDKAVDKLERCLENEVHKKVYNDSIIKRMDENQCMEIRAIADHYQVDLKLQVQKGYIEISGIASNVLTASDKIHGIMRDTVAFEQHKNAADILCNIVQWFYITVDETGQEVEPYEKDLNYKIENAYKNQEKSLTFITEQDTYKLDFDKMEEYPVNDPTDTVTVIRRDLIKLASFEPPTTWTDMTGNLKVVNLQAGTAEYQDIEQKFKSSSGGAFTVSKIERIQNKTLWQQYLAKKQQLENQNPQGTQNERLLWHGTAFDSIDNINAHGFNRSYCGKNATAYGDGVYFAVNASYSCSNTYARPSPAGDKRIYYCRVLTGEYTQGSGGMRVPPAKPGGASTALFDSVVDSPVGPGMYIIFHDTQAYPEYLLSFK